MIPKLRDWIMPVGTYYWTSKPVNPSDIWGGTWVQVEDKFVYAAGNKKAGTTGGSQTHTHALSDNGYVKAIATGSRFFWNYRGGLNIEYQLKQVFAGSQENANERSEYAMPLGGNTEASSYMPPYVTAYCWHRTA